MNLPLTLTQFEVLTKKPFKNFERKRENAGDQLFSPFPTMFSTLSKKEISHFCHLQIIPIWLSSKFCHLVVNSSSNYKIINLPILKSFADIKINVTQKSKLISVRAENIVCKKKMLVTRFKILSASGA